MGLGLVGSNPKACSTLSPTVPQLPKHLPDATLCIGLLPFPIRLPPSSCPCFQNKPCTFTSSSQVCSRENWPQYPPMLLYSFSLCDKNRLFFFFLRNDLYLLPPFNCSSHYLSPPRQFPKEWGPTLTHADAPRCRLSPVCAVTAPARGSLFIRRTHPVNRKTSWALFCDFVKSRMVRRMPQS